MVHVNGDLTHRIVCLPRMSRVHIIVALRLNYRVVMPRIFALSRHSLEDSVVLNAGYNNP